MHERVEVIVVEVNRRSNCDRNTVVVGRIAIGIPWWWAVATVAVSVQLHPTWQACGEA